MTQEPLGRYDRWSLLLLLSAAVLVFLTYDDYGITWDEGFHARYGEGVLQFYASGLRDHEAYRYLDLYYYGAAFDLLVAGVQRLSPLGEFETRHLLNGLVGWLGVVGCWMLARTLGGSRTGLIAVVLLLLTPRWWGHSFNNPKDIPYAAAYVWSVYYLVRAIPELPRIPIRLALLLGTAIGLALAMRVGGLVLLAYLVGASAVQLGFHGVERGFRDALQIARQQLASLLLVGITAWAWMLALWPWSQQRPLSGPFQALGVMSRFTWRGWVLFAGEQLYSTEIPRSYVPHWLAITLPELVLFGLLLALCLGSWSLVRGVRGKAQLRSIDTARTSLVAFSALFPIVYVMVQQPVLYDGMRHMLFVVPPLVCLAARGLDIAFERISNWRSSLAIASLSAVGVYLILQITVMLRLHPHEYVYFNQLVGGLPGAAGRYETDYWGNSIREAVELLVERLESESMARPPHYNVFICSNPVSATYFFPPYLSRTRDENEADFLVGTTRWKCHESLEGKAMVVVGRLDTPLAYVVDRRHVVPPRRRY